MLGILSACLLLFASSPARAGVSSFCPVGPCVFSDPTVVNVYWELSPTQWDLDVGGPSKGLTEMQLDAFNSGLAHSFYFSQLTQYGVNSVTAAAQHHRGQLRRCRRTLTPPSTPSTR